KGHFQIVRLLVLYGSDVSYTDDSGYTPLLVSPRGGHHKMVRQLLLEHGADASVMTKRQETPLSLSVSGGHEAVVQQLIEHDWVTLVHVIVKYLCSKFRCAKSN
ncbi:ankyrin repeat-containing domain protein, partial [Baffinella frigidus]